MSCIGRWILYHCTTREARYLLLFDKKYKYHEKCITKSRIQELCVCEILCYRVVLCIVCGGGVGGLQWGELPEEIDDRSSQHYCIIYFEVAQRLDFKCPYHKKEMIIM